MVPQLPCELIEEIVCDAGRFKLSHADLARLCLVDRRFLKAARKALYRWVTVAAPPLEHQSQAKLASSRGRRCLAVLAHPHLGAFVRTLSSTYSQDWVSAPTIDGTKGSELWQALLTLCPNVRHIFFSTYNLPADPVIQALRVKAWPISSVSMPLACPTWDWFAVESSCYEADFSRPRPSALGLYGLRPHPATSRVQKLALRLELGAADFDAIAATLGPGIVKLSLQFDPRNLRNLAPFSRLEHLVFEFDPDFIEKICNPSDPSAPWTLRAAREALRRTLATCAASLVRLHLWTGEYTPQNPDETYVEQPALLVAIPPHLRRLDIAFWSPFEELQNLARMAPSPSLRVLGLAVWRIPQPPFDDDQDEVEYWREVLEEWCEKRNLTLVDMDA